MAEPFAAERTDDDKFPRPLFPLPPAVRGTASFLCKVYIANLLLLSTSNSKTLTFFVKDCLWWSKETGTDI